MCYEINTTWAKCKNCVDNHNNKISWTDLTTKYTIVVDHAPFRYVCDITKEDPRSADQADFEDNYKG